jgi:hypothetical protein
MSLLPPRDVWLLLACKHFHNESLRSYSLEEKSNPGVGRCVHEYYRGIRPPGRDYGTKSVQRILRKYEGIGDQKWQTVPLFFLGNRIGNTLRRAQ